MAPLSEPAIAVPDDPDADLDLIDQIAAGEITSYAADEIRRILVERARRKIEALSLYQPLPLQDEFHGSRSRTRLVRGSNRAGKTLAAAVEFARAVTGRDPHGKYPKEEGRAFAIGKNLDHIGSVMWRKLYRPGAFRIIKDEVTQQWRAYRPWDPSDMLREKATKPAPALIPHRFIKSIAWEFKAKNIPKLVTLINGWEITFYSSEAKPPQGQDLDLWWFDEEIEDEDWFPEMSARVLDRKGCGFWSATPQAGTERLLALHERAELEENLPLPSVHEVHLLLADNPHIGEQEKLDLAANLTEEEQLVRIGGEFAITRTRVFPEFSLTRHGCDWFEIPSHWTRIATVDPGRQTCAVLFAAIPPGDKLNVYLYDELYIQNCDAELFGQKMAAKCNGQRFHSFIIDRHGGRITDMGSGVTVERQYSAALERHGVRCRVTGSKFSPGIDDVESGIEAFRGWLHGRGSQGPVVKILSGVCNNLDWELRHYRYKRVRGLVTDKPEDRGRVHLMACCRYLALSRPKFVKPQKIKQPEGSALRAFKEKQKRHKDKNGDKVINLGPGKEFKR